jgi:multimeric flavodoxin WrbA
MKVTAFVASPRKKGNTNTLVDHFLDGAKSKGADTEKVYLYDCNINPCQGCYKNCWINPNDCTRWNDDMHQLISKMLSSDLILFASPVYMASYTSQLTAFFERCIPLMHVDLENNVLVENRGKGKNVVLALLHDSPDLATADLPFKALEHVLRNTFQMNIAGKLQVTGVRNEGDIINKDESLKEAYQLAERLCTS